MTVDEFFKEYSNRSKGGDVLDKTLFKKLLDEFVTSTMYKIAPNYVLCNNDWRSAIKEFIKEFRKNGLELK